MTTPKGRHETTDGSIAAPCVCGEWHDLSFFLDAATRALPALLDVADATRKLIVLGINKDDECLYCGRGLNTAEDALAADCPMAAAQAALTALARALAPAD